ncbi:polysaccharide deacetylase family sporulation protein PdaB [Alteribacillus sp. HJP-4]|uniref:polysaccharide deacetylase family sporulation protein PdaB n=1 Tax=Alteribacillus sp. HJP-4 TaxID=2775394 RepID=UPI0035CCD33B
MAKRIIIVQSRQLKMFLIVLFIVAAAGSLVLRPSFLPVFSSAEEPAAFYKADIEDKKVALTFNVSWGEDMTEPILDTLKDKNVHATFFISASWAERHPDVVQRMIEEDHTIGNHGYQYEHYPRLDQEEIVEDLNLSHKKIKDVTEMDVQYFRPPHGDFNKEVLETIDRFGYDVIHWSVDGDDWENPGVDVIVKNITKDIEPGDVILLNASDSAKQTGEALPKIIESLNGNNYEFVVIEELISQAETSVNEVN